MLFLKHVTSRLTNLLIAQTKFALPGLMLALGHVIRGLTDLTFAAVIFVSLWCLSMISFDGVYLLVRCFTPVNDLWVAQSQRRWIIAWIVIWLVQAPFWLRALPMMSPLMLHEQLNLALTLYHVVLRRVGSERLRLPSMIFLDSAVVSPPHEAWTTIVARCSLPAAYIVCFGLAPDTGQALCFLLLDLVPALSTVVSSHVAEWRGLAVSTWNHSWVLTYPIDHSAPEKLQSDSDGAGCSFEDCDEHGTCSICLQPLCHPGGGTAVAGTSVGLWRRTAPGLAAARRRGRAQVMSLAAARTPFAWASHRVAKTKCGHSFHAGCLESAAESQPRCPDCRTSLASTVFGCDDVDEDEFNAHMLCSMMGIIFGGVLFIVAAFFGGLGHVHASESFDGSVLYCGLRGVWETLLATTVANSQPPPASTDDIAPLQRLWFEFKIFSC
eukprot:TRINITY_DN29528_c0_g1_i1.p1 TRINITY_DN29528_c0_g1~~TRINITY_DN29528_c0_g1_i1.p1  ORF type:complete len:439 (-),score=60.59 TRINITY_DN29528_c0_g1_i1:19-1335(-)